MFVTHKINFGNAPLATPHFLCSPPIPCFIFGIGPDKVWAIPPPLPEPDHPSSITCLLGLETSFCFHLFTVLFSFLGNGNVFLLPMSGIWKMKRVSVSKWSPWKRKYVFISNVLHLETTPIETILEISILNQQP